MHKHIHTFMHTYVHTIYIYIYIYIYIFFLPERKYKDAVQNTAASQHNTSIDNKVNQSRK